MFYRAVLSIAGFALAGLGSAYAQQQPSSPQQQPPAPTAPAPQTAVSDEDLETFADIFVSLQEASARYEADMAEAETQQDAENAQSRMQQEAIEKIDEHGWTIEKYSAVAQAVNSDPALAEKTIGLIEDRSARLGLGWTEGDEIWLIGEVADDAAQMALDGVVGERGECRALVDQHPRRGADGQAGLHRRHPASGERGGGVAPAPGLPRVGGRRGAEPRRWQPLCLADDRVQRLFDLLVNFCQRAADESRRRRSRKIDAFAEGNALPK